MRDLLDQAGPHRRQLAIHFQLNLA